MYKQIIIFSILFLGGAALNAVFEEIALDLDKTTSLSLTGDETEDEQNIDKLLRNLLNYEGSGPTIISTIVLNLLPSFFNGNLSCDQGLSLNNWQSQRPLFLLFHSFLFYDLL